MTNKPACPAKFHSNFLIEEFAEHPIYLIVVILPAWSYSHAVGLSKSGKLGIVGEIAKPRMFSICEVLDHYLLSSIVFSLF